VITEQAFQLLDRAFRKWEKQSHRNLHDANRDLAGDLMKDMAIYMQHGIIRLGDGLDAVNKLMRVTEVEQHEADEIDDMETLRQQLRGGK